MIINSISSVLNWLPPIIPIVDRVYSLVDNIIKTGIQKNNSKNQEIKKKRVVSLVFQLIIGATLGVKMYRVYSPLAKKILTAVGIEKSPDPFEKLNLVSKIFLAPSVCILVPCFEEIVFRGAIQKIFKDKFEPLYANLGCATFVANITARVTSVFFTSLIFGIYHFSNVITFRCSPVSFFPQVVSATISGLILGLAKELSGSLAIPIGMHIGNNTLVTLVSLRLLSLNDNL